MRGAYERVHEEVYSVYSVYARAHLHYTLTIIELLKVFIPLQEYNQQRDLPLAQKRFRLGHKQSKPCEVFDSVRAALLVVLTGGVDPTDV
jgi:hypothetical protein